jgi:hypothetical protein
MHNLLRIPYRSIFYAATSWEIKNDQILISFEPTIKDQAVFAIYRCISAQHCACYPVFLLRAFILNSWLKTN